MKRQSVRLREYRRLVATGRRCYSPCHVVYTMPFRELVIKASVKKRLGNAVRRNLEKRHIREALRHTRFSRPLLVLVVLTKPARGAFHEKKQMLLQCLRPLLSPP